MEKLIFLGALFFAAWVTSALGVLWLWVPIALVVFAVVVLR